MGSLCAPSQAVLLLQVELFWEEFHNAKRELEEKDARQ